MVRAQMKNIQDLTTSALEKYLPTQRDDAWLAAVVDTPRFGWDWPALEQGYFAPLRAWAAHHNARLRPVFAGLLIDAFGGDSHKHSDILAALELHYQASIMLDDLRNGRKLSTSTASSVKVPLPVWVTIAYNTRQLAPVFVMRMARSLSDASRVQLSHQFARFLFQQSLGSTLDLWGAEHELAHASLNDFIAHLSVYVGTLTFGLACDVARITMGLPEGQGIELSKAGVELGVALRLSEFASGYPRQLRVDGQPICEQLIRWHHGIERIDLAETIGRLRDSALNRARFISPNVHGVFSEFFKALQTPVEEVNCGN